METEQKNRPRPPSDSPGTEPVSEVRLPRRELHLDSGMSFCEAGREVIGFHFYRVLANEPGTVRGDDPEPLHDMRVAARRLRAALRAFRPAFGKRELAPYVDDVRWLGNLLGRIRDLDVFIRWLEQYEQSAGQDTRPYVRRVIQDRKNARVRERSALLSGLNSSRYHEFAHVFSDFCRDTTDTGHCRRGRVGKLAGRLIKQEMRRVKKAAQRTGKQDLSDSDSLMRLHRLRIQLKRLRYTAESFSNLMPDEANSLVKATRDLQDALGTVHDTNMHAQFLKEVRRVQSADVQMCDALDGMIQKLEEEQQAAYAKFRKKYRRFRPGRYARKIKGRLKRASAA